MANVHLARLDPRALDRGQHDHAVQFYAEDDALIAAMARFVREGLVSGQPLVLIATAPHREALLRVLERDGTAAEAFGRPGALCMLDAHEILATLMVDGMPDTGKFNASISALIERVQKTSDANTIRAFGEMVDVLWREGNAAAAIRLEMLWNSLAASHRFTLLCAYGLDNFRTDTHGFDIGDVCQLHTHVLPA